MGLCLQNSLEEYAPGWFVYGHQVNAEEEEEGRWDSHTPNVSDPEKNVIKEDLAVDILDIILENDDPLRTFSDRCLNEGALK